MKKLRAFKVGSAWIVGYFRDKLEDSVLIKLLPDANGGDRGYDEIDWPASRDDIARVDDFAAKGWLRAFAKKKDADAEVERRTRRSR